MSMISAQCDELRKTADELDEKAKAYAPTAHNTLSPMLRQAADTIWELRCKLAGVVDQRDEIERLKVENEKLRKYAKITADNLYRSGCDYCPYKDDHEACDLGIMPNGECRPYRELRELGIKEDA